MATPKKKSKIPKYGSAIYNNYHQSVFYIYLGAPPSKIRSFGEDHPTVVFSSGEDHPYLHLLRNQLPNGMIQGSK